MAPLQTPEQAAQWLHACACRSLRADTRQLQAGDGFIAWPGAAVDGRQFVEQALQRGASACLIEAAGAEAFSLPEGRVARYAGLKVDAGAIAAAFYQQPSAQLAVVGFTGTNGKTSSAWWLAQALSVLEAPWKRPCGLVGTLGVGVPPLPGAASALVPTGLTTPDPVLLQHSLHGFVQAGLQACAMEVSSIGLQEQRLAGTRVQVAVFTNLTQDHLDYHGDMASYWDAKRQLFDWPGLAAAVVNVDDAKGLELAQALQGRGPDVWTVSCTHAARLQARAIRYDGGALQFEVCEGAQAVPLHTRLIGSFNVANLLGVLAALRALGVPLVPAVQACGALQPVPGRMECLGAAGAPLVAVDYAHTPDALGQALAALRSLATQRGGQLWCVFGCGGDRDPSKRPLMGAIAAQGADRVVVTSDNPRSERPEAIIAQILLGLSPSPAVQVQADRAAAIAETVQRAGAADVILLAGKGHEAAQEIAAVKHPFSDRDHAAAALRARTAREVQP